MFTVMRDYIIEISLVEMANSFTADAHSII